MGTEIKDLSVVTTIQATDYLLLSRPGVTPNPIALVDKLPVTALLQAELDTLTTGQAGPAIKASYEGEANTNAFTDALKGKLEAIDAAHYGDPVQNTSALMALPEAGITDKERRFVEDQTSDYFYDATAVSGDIAPSDQTGGTGWWKKGTFGGESASSVKIKYESNPDTNAFDDAAQSKLAAIEAGATADQSDSEIQTAYANMVPKATGGELTAGTEVTVRRFSIADVTSLVAQHVGTVASGAGTAGRSLHIYTDAVKRAQWDTGGQVTFYNAAAATRCLLNHEANTPYLRFTQSAGKTCQYGPISAVASEDFILTAEELYLGDSGKSIGLYGAAPVPQATPIADASEAHAISATFTDTEVEAALNALGAKINALKLVLEAIGIVSE